MFKMTFSKDIPRVLFLAILSLIAKEAAAAPVVQTEPTGSVCQGDRVEFTCTGSGTLAWVVDGTQFPAFLASLHSVGSNFTVEGATAILTNIDTADPIMYTSTLTIPFVMDDVEIRCVDTVTSNETTRVMPLSISMVRPTVDSQLTSADVSVTATNLVCAGMYVIMATPINGGDAVNATSATSPVEVTGLNFCASNYTFTVMVQYRAGGNGPSATENNVQGDRMNLPPVTGLMAVDGGLQWTPPDLESNNLPNDCISDYEISWNGGRLILDGGNTASVSVSELMDAEFPLCMSTNVSVAPIVPAFGVVESKGLQTTLLHMPQSVLSLQNLEGKFVFLPSGGLVATNWMPLPSRILGSGNTPNYTCTNDTGGTTVQCDSVSSHTFTVPNSAILSTTPVNITVTAKFEECRVENSTTIEAVGATLTISPSTTSANVTLKLEANLFQNLSSCNAVGQLNTSDTLVHPTMGSSPLMFFFNFEGLSQKTSYECVIMVNCTNDFARVYGMFKTTSDPSTPEIPFWVWIIVALILIGGGGGGGGGIAYGVYRYKTSKAGKPAQDKQSLELGKPHNPSPPPTDQGATYAAPESIKHETGPETGELYAVATKPSKKKKNKQPEENLPTYQDPNTIAHETAGEGGDMYALPAKPKKGSKKMTAPEPPKPTEEELQQMYSVPDKSKKAQNQGMLQPGQVPRHGNY